MATRKILITGGMGFIGGNLLKYWTYQHPKDELILLDGLTYAARPQFVQPLIDAGKVKWNGQLDLRHELHVRRFIEEQQPTDVIHLAAESHVDRSIWGPKTFFETNVMGTFNLLNACRSLWAGEKNHRFHHVSTDEVFGQLTDNEAPFDEEYPLDPTSPYATSKAASDLMAMCFYRTYGMNVTITNCSNNYGENQHQEKLIPKAIQSILKRETMSVYGSGNQVRDWINVWDHIRAIDLVFHESKAGERYCVGGEQELRNVEIIEKVREAICSVTKTRVIAKTAHTDDRPTDDHRYAIDNKKIRSLGWNPIFNLETDLPSLVRWYMENYNWRLE